MNPAETMPSQPAITPEECQELAKELIALERGVLDFANRFRGRNGVDQRWLAIGVTDVEKGFMSVTKAICEAPLKAALAELEKAFGEIGK